MALTITEVKDSLDFFGATPVKQVTIAFDNAYPAGGYVITAASLGFRGIAGMVVIGVNTAGLVQEYRWNSQTGKLQVLMAAAAPAASADLTNATDIHLITITVLVIGIR